jgi:nucleoside-diphosphate-sugar epimerase
MASPIVLLGGSGFVGSSLARQLARDGAAVRIADRQPSAAMPHAWVRADVRDAADVARVCEGAETLYLLAAEHGLEPRPVRRFEEVNVGGARAVVAAAERVGLRRIVLTSTVAVYGLTGSVANEDSPCRPINDYGRTKLAAEAILRSWAEADPARALVIIRPTLIFGPGVRGHMRVLFHQLARPDFAMIGDGTNRKSFAHVENVAAFHAYLRGAGPGTQIYNYADGPDLTMAELTALIRTTLGLGPVVAHRSRRGALVRAVFGAIRASWGDPEPGMSLAQVRRFCSNTRFTSSRLAATGFQPRLALREAIRQYAHSDLRWAVPGAAAPAGRAAHAHSA